jgi:hypothetical protein
MAEMTAALAVLAGWRGVLVRQAQVMAAAGAVAAV